MTPLGILADDTKMKKNLSYFLNKIHCFDEKDDNL